MLGALRDNIKLLYVVSIMMAITDWMVVVWLDPLGITGVVGEGIYGDL